MGCLIILVIALAVASMFNIGFLFALFAVIGVLALLEAI